MTSMGVMTVARNAVSQRLNEMGELWLLSAHLMNSKLGNNGSCRPIQSRALEIRDSITYVTIPLRYRDQAISAVKHAKFRGRPVNLQVADVASSSGTVHVPAIGSVPSFSRRWAAGACPWGAGPSVVVICQPCLHRRNAWLQGHMGSIGKGDARGSEVSL